MEEVLQLQAEESPQEEMACNVLTTSSRGSICA